MKSIQKHNTSKILSENNIQNISIHTDNLTQGDAFCITKYVPEYVSLAIAKGAKYIISEIYIKDIPDNIIFIQVPDIKLFIRESCKVLYSNMPEFLIGITGTSGKSSIADFCRQISSHLGYKSASIGTVGVLCNDPKIEKLVNQQFDMSLTTADIVTTYRLLNFLAIHGVQHVAFEVSSHGLDQERIYGIELDGAIFSNLSQDHLDYHKNMQEYKEAKLKIFSKYLKKDGRAIILDDLYQDNDVKNAIKVEDKLIVGYFESGFKYDEFNGKYFAVKNITSDDVSQNIEFLYKNRIYKSHLQMIGRYQALNALMAAGMFLDMANIEKIISFFPKLIAVPGRLERITDLRSSFHIFVDFAHKPEAIEKCLKELRENCSGKLVIVFGCGGNRDKGKRKIMGEIASSIADIVIVTDDNPRFENPSEIRKNILEGASDAIEVPDRSNAIKKAVSMLEKDDILLIAGKGHEKYQIIGKEKIYFDDAQEVRKYL